MLVGRPRPQLKSKGELLVLGGARFVGLALLEGAAAEGWSVTAFSRDPIPTAAPGVEIVHGDRNRRADLERLADRTWDAVVDTWQGPPEATRGAASLLSRRTGHYGYVSSLQAYRWPPPRPLAENAPLLRPGGGQDGYPARKAASERIVREALGERALIARPGLVLGPREQPGRLPWWLLRLREGGDVLAPGPPSRPIQLVDARDLARWMLRAAERGLAGEYNVACPRGHASMGSVLEAAVRVASPDARLRWVDEEWLQQAGVLPWTEIPLWIPSDGEGAAFYDVDVSAALRAGVTFRGAEETVADTWSWLASTGPQARTAFANDERRLGRVRESRLLARWRAASGASP